MNIIYNKILYNKIIRDETILDSEIIQDIVNAKCNYSEFDINWNDSYGWSILTHAVSESVELVKYLLMNPDIDINCRTSLNSNTAFHVLCSMCSNRIYILKLFISHRDINVNAQNFHGWTGLYFACWNNHIECVRELLLDARVDLSIRDDLEDSALNIALKRRHIGIAIMLKKIGYTFLLRIPNASLCRDIIRMIIEEYT